MKIVILITVIESLAVMLAILYFYYRRGQSGKLDCSQFIDELLHRALVFRRPSVSITEQAKAVLTPGEYSHRSLPNQSGHSHDI